jgi:hypothetical protein
MSAALYRVAPIGRPYFGHGSYWTASADFARCFAEWANSRPELAHLGRHVIYRAEVELTGVLPLAETAFSDIVSAVTDRFAAEGHRWVSFIERGSDDGLSAEMAALVGTCPQYVYLGQAAIAAERVTT